MLYSEFLARTGVEVDSQEYVEIEKSYYRFNGNKDEFCAAWCKVNRKRVAAAKAAAAENKKHDRFFATLGFAAHAKKGDLQYKEGACYTMGVFGKALYAEEFSAKAKISIDDCIRFAEKYRPGKFWSDSKQYEINLLLSSLAGVNLKKYIWNV